MMRRYRDGVLNATTAPRLIELDAVHNFRDLGGYATADGRVTKWRTLYRADGLYRATPADVAVIESLGLRTVIDLRTEGELTDRGSYRPHTAADFHHVPVLDLTWSAADHPEYEHDVEFLVWAYREMLRLGSPRIADTFHLLAAPTALPAVFHCAAGKDRTGLVAALLLGSLGVIDEHICADYELTQAGMARMRVWAQHHFPTMFSAMADVPSAMLAALPEAIQVVLDDVRASHGSVRHFVESLGVDSGEIDHLAECLLD
jgi:protein-tyrosine phosphatase